MNYGQVIDGALNLREQPSTASNRLALIPNETTIQVIDYSDSWFAAKYGALSGYVLKQFILLLDKKSDIELSGKVVGGGLNLRKKASMNTDCLIQIPNGTTLVVVDFDIASDWYRTSYQGYSGYVRKAFVEIHELNESEWMYGRVTSSTLNVRKQPSLSASLWNDVWPMNRIALIKPSVNGWYETLYRGQPAYVYAQHIDLLDDQVPDNIVDRMMFLAQPELGRTNSVYFNGYTGNWCHRFADWLAMHAAMPRTMIPNTSNCGTGIVWFVNDLASDGFFFKNASHKSRMTNAYPAINHLAAQLSEEEQTYVPSPGDYVYFRWNSAAISVNVSHVGIVRSVSDDSLTTFEGNSNNSVVSREFLLADDQIVGYGRPLYLVV